MKRLLGVELKGYVFYDHAKFRLDHKGITVVYGRNINAGQDSGNSNESGKSLLVSSIPQLRYEAAPINTEAKTKGKKDSWASDTSVRLLVHDTQTDTQYEATKTRAGASFAYNLVRNGKPAKTRTSEYFYQKLESEVLPWSETEFYTRIYLDSRRPAALQLGSPVQRLEFFSDLWHLDHIDNQRKLVKQYLDELKEGSIVRSEVEGQIAAVQAELAELPRDADLGDEKARYEKLLRRQRKLLNTQATLRAVSALMDDYAKVKQYGATSDQLLDWLTAAKVKQKKAKRRIAAAREWATYREQVESVTAKRDKYKSELLVLQPTTWFKKSDTPQQIADTWDNNRERLLALKSEVRELKAQASQSDLPEQQARLDNLLQEIEADSTEDWLHQHGYAEGAEGMTTLSQAIQKFREDLVTYQRDAERDSKALKEYEALFAQKGACDCPTCHQVVSEESQTAMLSGLKSSLRTLTKRTIPGVTGALAAMETVQAAQELELHVADAAKAERKRKKRLAAATEEFEQLAEGYEPSKRSIELADKLADMDKVTPPDAPEESGDVDELVSKYEALLSLIATVETIATHADTCKGVEDEYGTELDDTLQGIDASLSSLDAKITALQNELAEAETASRLRKKCQDQLAALQQRLDELDSSDDDEVAAVLYDALANKNLKTLLVQRLASHLEANMNRNAPLLFREPIRFEFGVETNNFHILYHRTYSTGVKTSDVRTLSGAGSRAFNFLLALSLIPLTPDSSRCNLMIMDEPCVNLDEAFTEKFCNEFLPKLISVVESVIVISPTPLDIPATRVVCVVKEGGVSRLETIK